MLVLVAFLLLALCVSFLCSILEASLMSTPISYIALLEDEGKVYASRLRKYKQDSTRPLAAILSLNTIANTVGAAGVGRQATDVFGSEWFGLVSAVMTVMILVISEIIPKTIGTSYWKSLPRFTTSAIRSLIFIMYPVVLLVEFLQKLISPKHNDISVSREEIGAMADVAEETGELEEDENEIIQNLINIDELSVKDAMTPRVVAAIAPESMTIKAFYKDRRFLHHSRIPVYKDNDEYITGYILRMDALQLMAEDKFDTRLADIKRPVSSFQMSEAIDKVWDTMVDSKEQIAIVINEYGAFEGLITMEDIIETVLGDEIVDERDTVVDMQQLAREKWRTSRIVKCFIILSIFISSSCSKTAIQLPVSGEKIGEPCTIEACMGEWSDSRTSLGGDFSVVWSENDAIAIVSSDNKVSKFTISSGWGTATASFTGTFSGEAPYFAVYPYSESVSVSDGCLCFSLPEVQDGTLGNILPGASPAVAGVPSDKSSIQFKNPCSLMCLSLKGTASVSRIALHDLNGAPLWGNVRIPLNSHDPEPGILNADVSGGNTLTLRFPSAAQLNTRTYKKIYFAVPAGSFSRGFSAVFFDRNGAACAYVQTQADNTVQRSSVLVFPDASTGTLNESAKVSERGYYRDLFMDGGIALTSRLELYAASHIGFSMELFSSSGSRTVTPTEEDYALQKQIICGSEMDENGVLLYPDGSPRFRCVYMNGGSASSHGESLGEEGLGRYRTFNANGGSYVGTCAGAFLGSTANSSNPSNPNYLHLWSGRAVSTKVTVDGKRVSMLDASHRMIMEPGSPLERYFSFPEIIGDVYHNGGCWMDSENSVVGGVTVPFPKGTEVLMRYYTPGSTPERDSSEIHMQASIWAWKKDAATGRVVLCGSHPEMKKSGAQRDLMGAMLLYAADGCGVPSDKGTILAGVPRVMDRKWSDGDPLNAGIGDMQYHHFKIDVPQNPGTTVLVLESKSDADLYLALRKDGPAWISDADYLLCNAGGNKKLEIDNLEPGSWYLSVYCPVKLTSIQHTSGKVSYFTYSGKTEVLNGIPYTVSLSFEK